MTKIGDIVYEIVKTECSNCLYALIYEICKYNSRGECKDHSCWKEISLEDIKSIRTWGKLCQIK